MDYELWLRMRPHATEEIFVDDVLSIARSHPEQKSVFDDQGDEGAVFTSQRVYAAVRSARMRGENPFTWLMRIWNRRFNLAVKKKKMYMVLGSAFHRQAIRAVLFGDYKRKVAGEER
jgi:hypothetical protein